MTKYVTIAAAIILAGAFVPSCSGNSSGTNSTGNEAHFSCSIDGQAVSGGAIDQMQIYNVASMNQVDEGKELLFYLNDAKSPETIQSFAHALRFSIPCKTGPVSFGHDENGWGIEVDVNSDKDHPATYFSDSFTVNVSEISSTQTVGTFSGKFRLREGALSGNAKKEIEVSDGKFAVPMKK